MSSLTPMMLAIMLVQLRDKHLVVVVVVNQQDSPGWEAIEGEVPAEVCFFVLLAEGGPDQEGRQKTSGQ